MGKSTWKITVLTKSERIIDVEVQKPTSVYPPEKAINQMMSNFHTEAHEKVVSVTAEIVE